MELSARAKIKRAQRNANTSGSSISDPGVPRTSHARQAEQFLDAREFKMESSARAKTKDVHRCPIVDAAICATDVYHREHHGASCTDFHLKRQCGNLHLTSLRLALQVLLPRFIPPVGILSSPSSPLLSLLLLLSTCLDCLLTNSEPSRRSASGTASISSTLPETHTCCSSRRHS